MLESEPVNRTLASRLRVVHVLGALPIGGVEYNLVHLLPNMMKRNLIDVTVVSLTDLGPMGEVLSDIGIPVMMLGNSFYIYDFRNTFALWDIIRQLKPDIVHTHLPAANLHGRLAALLAQVPVIVAHEHSRTD